jgi:hypothetical protein
VTTRTFMDPGQETDPLVVAASDVRVDKHKLANSKRCGVWCNLDHSSHGTRTDGQRSRQWVLSFAIVNVSRVRQNTGNAYAYNCAARGTLWEGHCLNSWVFANLR